MDPKDWDERYAASELIWSATPNQFVAAELADLPPGRAVDLAAGEGRNAIWLAGLGWEVTAVDFSQVALDKGRQLSGEREITWLRADATSWSAETETDLVVIAYLQLAAPERRAAIRNGFTALRPGGTFLLVAHDTTNLTEGTGGPQDAGVLMTAEDVLGDLAGLDGATYDVVRAERVARTVEAGHRGDPDRTAYDCLVRLVRTS